MLFRRVCSIGYIIFASRKGLDILHQKLGFFRNGGLKLELTALTNHPNWLHFIKREILLFRQWDGVRSWVRFFLNGCAIRVVGEEQIIESEAALDNRKSLQVRDGVSKECWKIHYLRISRWKLGSMGWLVIAYCTYGVFVGVVTHGS